LQKSVKLRDSASKEGEGWEEKGRGREREGAEGKGGKREGDGLPLPDFELYLKT